MAPDSGSTICATGLPRSATSPRGQAHERDRSLSHAPCRGGGSLQPGFLASVVRAAAREHEQRSRGRPLPTVLVYLVVPLALHGPTRRHAAEQRDGADGRVDRSHPERWSGLAAGAGAAPARLGRCPLGLAHGSARRAQTAATRGRADLAAAARHGAQRRRRRVHRQGGLPRPLVLRTTRPDDRHGVVGAARRDAASTNSSSTTATVKSARSVARRAAERDHRRLAHRQVEPDQHHPIPARQRKPARAVRADPGVVAWYAMQRTRRRHDLLHRSRGAGRRSRTPTKRCSLIGEPRDAARWRTSRANTSRRALRDYLGGSARARGQPQRARLRPDPPRAVGLVRALALLLLPGPGRDRQPRHPVPPPEPASGCRRPFATRCRTSSARKALTISARREELTERRRELRRLNSGCEPPSPSVLPDSTEPAPCSRNASTSA